MRMNKGLNSWVLVMQSDTALQDRPEEYERARGKYIIDNETMKILPKHSVIMHPLPRVDEVGLQRSRSENHAKFTSETQHQGLQVI